jgi:single-strand DNA-binding protein
MMNNLNSILIEGNLVQGPKLSHTSKGTSICQFSLYFTRFYKQDDDDHQKEVSIFEITTRDKLANLHNDYLKKDKTIRIVGRLKQGRITEDNGESKSKVYIVAEHIDFKPEVS